MNKKVVLSVLATAVVASMAASAFAAPKQGLYIGGNVKKFYSTSTLLNMTKDARTAYKNELKTAGFQNLVFVNIKGQGATIKEMIDLGTKVALADPLKQSDFLDSYGVVQNDGTVSGTEEPGKHVDPTTPGELKVESVSAITKTKVTLKFNKDVDAVKAENFTVAGASVTAATLAEDKRSVTLTLSGLSYGTQYTLVTKQVLVDGKPIDVADSKFTTPPVTDLYNLELTTSAPGDQILANGIDNLVVTAKLLDKVTGQVDTNADNVVIEFRTTYGNLGNTRVTVQNGIATVTLRSEFSQQDLVAKVDAKVIEASGDYKELIGQIIGTKDVHFKVKLDDINPDQKPAVVSAGSNQADRLTVNFNKDVTVTDFAQYDEVAKKFKLNADNTLALKAGTSITVSQKDNNGQTVTKKVLGLKPVSGNTKALEVILDRNEYLTDNKAVEVQFVQDSNVGPQTTKADFILADARKPEATSAVSQDLKTVKVKFSEAIAKADVSLDGGITEIESSVPGEFNAATLEDTRDVLTIKTKNYLTAGVHSVQLSKVYDFAGYTDEKNISTSQSLDFSVAGDDSIPTSTVSVESPEQFRVVFNKQVSGLTVANTKLQVAVKNADGTVEWKNVEDTTNKYAHTPQLTIDTVSDSEYVFELTQDWTRIYNTNTTTKNYYNDNYRLFIPAKSVVNPANGKQNVDIIMPLNDSIMTTPDTTSPAIRDIKEIASSRYNVEMSKPVKLPGKDNHNPQLDTPSQSQGTTVPTPIVEFLGKDKDGNVVTIKGAVVDYTDTNKADKQFEVVPQPEPGQDSPQAIVNKGGSQTWTLVVRSISDDVGNTAQTLTKDFTIKPDVVVADDVFMVEGKLPDNTDWHGVVGYLNGAGDDTVVLTFTSGVQYTGTDKNAVNPSNYTLDGENLPKGTLITVEDADNNIANGYERVVITLRNDTLKTAQSNVITVSKNLVSYKGTKLTGKYAVTFVPELGVEPTDLQAAKAVDTQIGNLPATITLADQAAVTAARTAYNNLSAAQKPLVKNFAKLQAAEAKITQLLQEQTEAVANLAAAQTAVTDLETAANADLTVKANLETAEAKVTAAETAVAKVAAGENKTLLQAKLTVAKKKVTDARTAFDAQATADTQAVTTAKDALDLGNTTAVEADLTLPTTGANGVSISWLSSDAAVVSNTGTVTRPANGAGNATVTLTATLTKGAASTTKTFTVTVVEAP
ncbi:sugar-binding domain protein [Brevibacillus parabrevis]|uniref:immunoglobulin-like domain-containing protein n=1 Tax=Brevibacillus parabrevis TaxID=54914 RepID=UPI0007ABFD45|nr:immunoglobulin-like domain-containing protein [Brevibacillus parabrevis]KZE49511.1 sugar-binding domain protein [Brevibacillus parabrevis]